MNKDVLLIAKYKSNSMLDDINIKLFENYLNVLRGNKIEII